MRKSKKLITKQSAIQFRHNLDAKISALASGNVSKYQFLTTKDILPEKYLLEKAAALKRFEY